MDEKGWTPAQIDEIDYYHFLELLKRKKELSNPAEKKKAERRNQKVVPIDAVF